jgi:hypothetical protein
LNFEFHCPWLVSSPNIRYSIFVIFKIFTLCYYILSFQGSQYSTFVFRISIFEFRILKSSPYAIIFCPFRALNIQHLNFEFRYLNFEFHCPWLVSSPNIRYSIFVIFKIFTLCYYILPFQGSQYSTFEFRISIFEFRIFKIFTLCYYILPFQGSQYSTFVFRISIFEFRIFKIFTLCYYILPFQGSQYSTFVFRISIFEFRIFKIFTLCYYILPFQGSQYSTFVFRISIFEFRILNQKSQFYSHSIVAGGLLLMSYTTRLIPFTSLIIRFDTLAKNS